MWLHHSYDLVILSADDATYMSNICTIFITLASLFSFFFIMLVIGVNCLLEINNKAASQFIILLT